MGKTYTPINTPNDTKYFYPADDNRIQKLMPCKASTAFAVGAAMGVEISGNDVTGNITLLGTTNASGANFVGIMVEPVVSTDADYATAGKLKSMRVPTTPMAKAFFYVGAGTFTAADVFKVVNIHTDSLGLAVDTKGLGAVIEEYISSSKGICSFSVPRTLTA